MAEKSADSSPSEATNSKQEERPSGNWWDSWLTSAKSKSAEVYTMVKKDLDEIGSAVKSEASHVFSSTSTVIGKTLKLENPESTANVMKKSLSTFIGQVSTVLNPEPDDEDDTEVILSSGDTTMLSTYKKELEGLQRVDATFIVPAHSAEFEAWRATQESGALISPLSAAKRLDSSPLLRAQYDKLVPDAVSHDEFWERYLFRVALLQDRLAGAARRSPPSTDPVMQHLPMTTPAPAPAHMSPKKAAPVVESDRPYDIPDIDNAAVTWEDELSEVQPDLNFAEDFANDVELTEEQQILLLEEYEREISNKKQTKNPRDLTNNNSNKQTSTITKSKTKAAQTRDKMNNKQTTTVDKKVSPAIDKKTVKNKIVAQKQSPKKTAKDVCGNDLVEDYFAEKDDVIDEDSNSDESWEKEFEIDDVVQKA